MKETMCFVYIYRPKEGIWYCATQNTPVQTSTLRNTRARFSVVESYSSKRKQFLVINNTQSDISDLCEYGVPQGSVLGPVLFLLFINDIHRSLSEITVKLFADDTNCFISDKDFNSLKKLAERELNKLQKWINTNKVRYCLPSTFRKTAYNGIWNLYKYNKEIQPTLSGYTKQVTQNFTIQTNHNPSKRHI